MRKSKKLMKEQVRIELCDSELVISDNECEIQITSIDTFMDFLFRNYKKTIHRKYIKELRANAFKNWQKSDEVYSLTCPECSFLLKISDDVLECVNYECDYEQQYIPDIVFEKYFKNQKEDN